MRILGVVSGSLGAHAKIRKSLHLGAGQFCLVPARRKTRNWEPQEDSTHVLEVGSERSLIWKKHRCRRSDQAVNFVLLRPKRARELRGNVPPVFLHLTH